MENRRSSSKTLQEHITSKNETQSSKATLQSQNEHCQDVFSQWKVPSLLWQLVSTPYVSVRSDGSLHLERVRLQDGGDYTCMASSVAGTTNSTTTVHVFGEQQHGLGAGGWGGAAPTTAAFTALTPTSCIFSPVTVLLCKVTQGRLDPLHWVIKIWVIKTVFQVKWNKTILCSQKILIQRWSSSGLINKQVQVGVCWNTMRSAIWMFHNWSKEAQLMGELEWKKMNYEFGKSHYLFAVFGVVPILLPLIFSL